MAFFSTISATLLAPATETTTAEGVNVYELKGLNTTSNPGIPVLMYVDKTDDCAEFLKGLAAKTTDGTPIRVLVSGIIQNVPAQKANPKDKYSDIEKPSKVIVYVGAARRLRADVKIDPEQALIFGSGFVQFIGTEMDDKTKRKPEITIQSGTQSLQEEGKYSGSLVVQGEKKTGTDETCMTVDEGREVYFMAHLFRSAGVYQDTPYDKIKCQAVFMEETDRVKSKRGGRKSRSVSMSSQLSDSFEETESTAAKMNSTDLCQQANVSLSDF